MAPGRCRPLPSATAQCDQRTGTSGPTGAFPRVTLMISKSSRLKRRFFTRVTPAFTATNQSINQFNSFHFISFIDLFFLCVCVCACVSHGSLQSNQHNYNQQLIQAFNRTPTKPPQSNPPPPPPPPPPIWWPATQLIRAIRADLDRKKGRRKERERERQGGMGNDTVTSPLR